MPTYLVRVEADDDFDHNDASAIERAIFAAGLVVAGPDQGNARYVATVDLDPVDENDHGIMQLPCGHTWPATGRIEPGDTIDCHYHLCHRIRVAEVERVTAVQIITEQED